MSILWRYLILLAVVVVAAFLVFGGDGPPEDGAPDARAFAQACEAGPFAAANSDGPADAVRLCACLLAWHLQEGGGRLPVGAYAAGVADSGDTDRRARRACLSGRIPR